MADSGAGAGPAAGVPAGSAYGNGVARGRGSLGRLLRRAAAPVVSAQTWLAVIHLTAGVVAGALAFGVVLALGLPVLVAALWLCLQFGRAERARFAVTLGVHIPAPPLDLSPGAGVWRRM